jgi:hypothetical protein
MEMAEEYGHNCMGENNDNEDEDDDDEGNVVAPPTPAPVPEEIIEEEAPVEMVFKQEDPVAHEVILVDTEPEQPEPESHEPELHDREGL